MIEIDKIDAFYLCNKQQECAVSEDCDMNTCNHTKHEIYAKNADAVMIYNLFCDTFDAVVDDYGKLIIYEKEKKDGK